MEKVKNRSIRRLLILLRDSARVSQVNYGTKGRVRLEIPSGLCQEANHLGWDEVITNLEWNKLKKYIYDNRPKWKWDENYGWKPKLWKPRLKWLNEQIELMETSSKMIE